MEPVDYYQKYNISNRQESPIWFTRKDFKRKVKRRWNGKKRIKRTKSHEWWDYSNCFVSAVKRKEEGKIRIIIRNSNVIWSDYRKKYVKLKYMIGFDVNQIGELEEDQYNEPLGNPNNQQGKLRARWVLKLDEEHFIWQWKQNEEHVESIELAKKREELKNIQDKAYDPTKGNIFMAYSEQNDNRVTPVIYQPAVDSLQNFLREVHCNKINDKNIEVTLVFNNEHLTAHKSLDKIYRIIRLILYHRVADIESFIINLDNSIPKTLQFRNIFSGENDLKKDDVHGDRPKWYNAPIWPIKYILRDQNYKAPKRRIKYYFNHEKHPIVFINTANHAMSYRDANHTIWKWEYIPWEENGPVILGEKSRKELESATWDIYSEDWIEKYHHKYRNGLK